MFSKLIKGKTEYDRGLQASIEGDKIEAITLFSKAIVLNSKLVGVRRDRGKLYHESGQYRQAIGDFTRELELRKSAATYLDRARSYESREKYQAAIDDCAHAIALEPQNPDLYYHRSKIYLVSQEPIKAMDDLNKALEYYPNSPKFRIAKGTLLVKFDRHEEAFAEFSLVRYIDPNDFENYLITSKIHLHTGNFGLALIDLQVAKTIVDRLNNFARSKEITDKIKKVQTIQLAHEQKILKKL
jgi:tetratricopeptide (TPR) repeat protein